MFLVSVPRIFKITGKATVVESLFNKLTEEISAFYNSFENSITCIGMLRKVAILEVSRIPLSTGVAGL